MILGICATFLLVTCVGHSLPLDEARLEACFLYACDIQMPEFLDECLKEVVPKNIEFFDFVCNKEPPNVDDESEAKFAKCYEKRMNDGLIHAFDSTTGRDKLCDDYRPRALLDKERPF